MVQVEIAYVEAESEDEAIQFTTDAISVDFSGNECGRSAYLNGEDVTEGSADEE